MAAIHLAALLDLTAEYLAGLQEMQRHSERSPRASDPLPQQPPAAATSLPAGGQGEATWPIEGREGDDMFSVLLLGEGNFSFARALIRLLKRHEKLSNLGDEAAEQLPQTYVPSLSHACAPDFLCLHGVSLTCSPV